MPKTACPPPRPQTFDLVKSPLEAFTLIDASAGTGKTYTICGLVLRFLLEENLGIDQVLVVTYTEAAAEDLRRRIRLTLEQALDALSGGAASDPFLQRYLDGVADPGEAVARLGAALRGFDEAPLFTIHGFCQRMLLENSLMTQVPFDAGLVPDDTPLVREIIEDFWRRELGTASSLFSRYVAKALNPEKLLCFLLPFLPHPVVHLIAGAGSGYEAARVAAIEIAYKKARHTVCNAWPEAREAVLADLRDSTILKRTTYNKTGITELTKAMDTMARENSPAPELFKKFSLLTTTSIRQGTKKNKAPNILPFYEQCETLFQAHYTLVNLYEQKVLDLRQRLLETVRPALAQRKKRDNIFSFDDLLHGLGAALSGPGGKALGRTLARRFPVAFIDEFQDTDPLQFAIFSAIHRAGARLFLIGDPKQAIYSFRGADIFTYMEAAANTPGTHHTLGVNYRSSPALIKAVNTLFGRVRDPFLFKAIGFFPASATPHSNKKELTIDGLPEEPFILCCLSGPEEEPTNGRGAARRITRDMARKRISAAVARETVRLLQLGAAGRARLGSRQLRPGDIGILVRTNFEARSMQEALASSGVESVLHSSEDLFASEEAQETTLLLAGVEKPWSRHRVKAALLTRYFGLTGAECGDEKSLADWLLRFRAYHSLWTRFGFIQMFWAVLRENNVHRRLLGTTAGERSLTNILHLAEILHRESTDRTLNMVGLLNFLQKKLTGEAANIPEHLLRLESDNDRVKIVTIHKAKGLEYPVVFYPSSWEGTRLRPGTGFFFHRSQAGGKSELVFAPPGVTWETYRQAGAREELAENLRLLYVALTRAAHRCYLFWGPISGAETSAPAYLLHQERGRDSGPDRLPQSMEAVQARFRTLSESGILADLQELVAASGKSIRLTQEEGATEPYEGTDTGNCRPLQARRFSGTADREWKISSFSSLTGTRGPAGGVGGGYRDRDGESIPFAADGEKEEKDVDHALFFFPRGAKPGTMFHEILERADFSQKPAATAEFICGKLLNFGYDPSWGPAIAGLLADLQELELHREIPGLRLGAIARRECLHELEFYFPLARITPELLREIFRSAGKKGVSGKRAGLAVEQLAEPGFDAARGLMRGFIDLVFRFQGRYYLLDWKSNHLGDRFGHYRRERLNHAVWSTPYFLQYHIYSLALHLFLARRLPGYRYDKDFGGVFYLFLRGVSPVLGSDYGIYHDRPDREVIEMLQARLVAGLQKAQLQSPGGTR